MQLQSRDQTKAISSQLIGQFGHVTASASCKQPEKQGISLFGQTEYMCHLRNLLSRPVGIRDGRMMK